jgi:hypothetical protein
MAFDSTSRAGGDQEVKVRIVAKAPAQQVGADSPLTLSLSKGDPLKER